MSHFPDLNDLPDPVISSSGAADELDMFGQQPVMLNDSALFGGHENGASNGADDFGFMSATTAAPVNPPASSSLDAFSTQFPPVESMSPPSSFRGGNDAAFAVVPAPPLSYRSTGSNSMVVSSSPYASIPPVSGESEFIREWREKRAAVIAERESRSAEEHARTVDLARRAIDRFYEDYNQKRDKSVKANREASAGLAEQIMQGASGTTAASAASGKGQSKGGKDVSRMRNLLLDLRKDPKAPGTVSVS